MSDETPRLAHAERALGVSFTDTELLRAALTHPSSRDGSREKSDFERLEFLGDAVVRLVVSEHLYATFPDVAEGELTKRTIALVSGRSLAAAAAEARLGDAISTGEGIDLSDERRVAGVLEDTLEALVGAVYLDAGLAQARAVVRKLLGDRLDSPEGLDTLEDPKSLLQERLQVSGGSIPEYRHVDFDGPDHDRVFTAEVSRDGTVLGRGEGRSKKDAERSAAAAALRALDGGRG